MDVRFTITVLLALTAGVAVAAAERGGITLTHHEAPGRIQMRAAGSGDLQKPGATAPVLLGFEALGRAFELELAPNANLLAAIPAERRNLVAVPYRGRIAGNARSWARIVMIDGAPVGLIWDGDELIALERPGDALVDTALPIAYRLADTIVAPGAMSCAGGTDPVSGAQAFEKLVGGLAGLAQQGPGAVSELYLGAIGDSYFTTARGASAQADLVARLNNVDGIFSEQLGVQLTLREIEMFDSASDPFTNTTDPGALLSELGAYRSATPAQNSQGLTHLYTGRDLNGTTVGIAYSGSLCSNGFGAGLSEGNGGTTFDSLIAAHEIGHNFGAPHDTVAGPCESEPADYIMATTLNGSDQFSACSIAEMQPHIDAASCIAPLPTTDISVSFGAASSTVFLSNLSRVTLDVVNYGTQVSGNVVVDITLPGIVSYVDASGGSATCTSGAGTVSCQLGDVPGSSTTTIAVTADTLAPGSGDYTATVTADTDERPGNNQDTLPLTVDPAVSLVVNSPLAPEVIVDQSTTISGTLDNLSPLAATNVLFSVTLDAGLRADSATWSLGNCTVSAQQVDCQALQFAGLSGATFSLGVTGVQTGNRAYSVTLAADEAEADPADNDFSGSLRVRSQGGGGDDEGGGRLGSLFVLVLAGLSLLAAWRRRSGVRPLQVRDVRRHLGIVTEVHVEGAVTAGQRLQPRVIAL